MLQIDIALHCSKHAATAEVVDRSVGVNFILNGIRDTRCCATKVHGERLNGLVVYLEVSTISLQRRIRRAEEPYTARTIGAARAKIPSVLISLVVPKRSLSIASAEATTFNTT